MYSLSDLYIWKTVLEGCWKGKCFIRFCHISLYIVWQDVKYPSPKLHYCVDLFLNFCQSYRYKIIIHCILVCVFLIANEIEYSFICLWVIRFPLLLRDLLKFFSESLPLKNWFIWVIYMFWLWFLCGLYELLIFSSLLWHLFSFIIGFFINRSP